MGIFGRAKGSGTVGGIDLGGTKIAAAVVGPEDTILASARRPTPTRGGPETVTREIAETMREAAESAGLGTADLDGIGIGAPGMADRQTGVLSGAGNLPGWSGSYPLGPELSGTGDVKFKERNGDGVAREPSEFDQTVPDEERHHDSGK